MKVSNSWLFSFVDVAFLTLFSFMLMSILNTSEQECRDLKFLPHIVAMPKDKPELQRGLVYYDIIINGRKNLKDEDVFTIFDSEYSDEKMKKKNFKDVSELEDFLNKNNTTRKPPPRIFAHYNAYAQDIAEVIRLARSRWTREQGIYVVIDPKEQKK